MENPASSTTAYNSSHLRPIMLELSRHKL